MSKFSAAMNAAKDRGAAVAPPTVPVARPDTRPGTQKAAGRLPRLAAAAPRRGRPAGKRSSASTIQVTAYIEASTHVETKIQLLQNARNHGQKQDFSELVQHLLSEWLKRQK